MSNRLLNLVWGAQPFGTPRTGPSMRLVLAALADRVDELRHGTWCYPGLQELQERTEMGRRTVLRALSGLRAGKWIRVESRPGYGSIYHFDLNMLEAAQRPKKERRLKGTRALEAPVPLAMGRGALSDGKGCLERLPYKEEPALEPAVNPSTPLRVVGDIATAKKRTAKPKAIDPRHAIVKGLIEAAVKRQGSLFFWDGPEAGQLGRLLRAAPADQVPIQFFERCIANWESSPVNHGQRPCKWIGSLPDFQNGVLDRYRNVEARKPTSKPRSAVQKAREAA